jgi:hypothetical protein
MSYRSRSMEREPIPKRGKLTYSEALKLPRVVDGHYRSFAPIPSAPISKIVFNQETDSPAVQNAQMHPEVSPAVRELLKNLFTLDYESQNKAIVATAVIAAGSRPRGSRAKFLAWPQLKWISDPRSRTWRSQRLLCGLEDNVERIPRMGETEIPDRYQARNAPTPRRRWEHIPNIVGVPWTPLSIDPLGPRDKLTLMPDLASPAKRRDKSIRKVLSGRADQFTEEHSQMNAGKSVKIHDKSPVKGLFGAFGKIDNLLILPPEDLQVRDSIGESLPQFYPVSNASSAFKRLRVTKSSHDDILKEVARLHNLLAEKDQQIANLKKQVNTGPSVQTKPGVWNIGSIEPPGDMHSPCTKNLAKMVDLAITANEHHPIKDAVRRYASVKGNPSFKGDMHLIIPGKWDGSTFAAKPGTRVHEVVGPLLSILIEKLSPLCANGARRNDSLPDLQKRMERARSAVDLYTGMSSKFSIFAEMVEKNLTNRPNTFFSEKVQDYFLD